MKLVDTIKKELVNYFINYMKENRYNVCNNYGKFIYTYDCFYSDYNVEKGSLGKLIIGEKYNSIYQIPIQRHKFSIFHKKTDDRIMENDLYEIFTEKKRLADKQAEIYKYERLLDMLPEEKKKQILREQKLGRITNEKN